MYLTDFAYLRNTTRRFHVLFLHPHGGMIRTVLAAFAQWAGILGIYDCNNYGMRGEANERVSWIGM
jgi:hypothetical protein